MRFWIDVDDLDNNRVGEGPVIAATRCRVRERLSRVGDFDFEVSATDPRAALLTARRGVSIMGIVDGAVTYLGGGSIEDLRTRIDNDGLAMLSVKGPDLLRELVRILTGAFDLNDTGNTNVDSLLDLITLTPLEWEYTRAGSSPAFSARLAYESIFQSMVSIAEKTGAQFRRQENAGEPRHVQWFYTSDDSSILATMHGDPDTIRDNPQACLITDIEVIEDAYDLKTHVYAFGAGEGASQMTMVGATLWPDGTTSIDDDYVLEGQTYRHSAANNRIINITATESYPRDEIALAFKDIAPLTNSVADVTAAANFLVGAAVEWLHAHRQPLKSYKLRVAGLNGPLLVGQTLRVQARRFREGEKPINLDETLYVLEKETTIDSDGMRTSALVVANMRRWPTTGGEIVARELASTKVLSSHPQTGPNVDTIPYREHVDDDHTATLWFWLGEETTTVQSVVVRLKVDPLRSTVRSVGGTEVSSGPSSAATSSDGSLHSHAVNFTNGVPTYPMGVQAGGTSTQLYANGASGDLATTTEGDHTHDIPHTHDVTAAVTMSYGVFDEDPGNTYAATDLEWKTIDDADWTPITVADDAGVTGWYQIDITANVSDTGTFRPTRAANNIQLRVIAASYADKSAQITGQIERRTSIQSIAVY